MTISPPDGSSAPDSLAPASEDQRSETLAHDPLAALLRRAATLCRERRDDLARFMAIEMGKRTADAHDEIELCARIFEYYADLVEQPPAGDTTLLREPLGVVAGIQPQAYPCYQFDAPHLMAGNVVLLKHGSSIQQCAEAAEELLQDGGLPSDASTSLVASSGLAIRVIDDNRVRGVSVTRSDADGGSVTGRAGRNVKKIVPAPRDSDAFDVPEDADLDSTVDCTAWGRMNNVGQSCVASK